MGISGGPNTSPGKSTRHGANASRNGAAGIWSNFLETVGNGRPARTPAIRDTSPFLERWANTTASLCPVRWYCVEDPASHPPITCARPIAISFNLRRGGSSLEFAWQPERNFHPYDYLASRVRLGAPRRIARTLSCAVDFL